MTGSMQTGSMTANVHESPICTFRFRGIEDAQPIFLEGQIQVEVGTLLPCAVLMFQVFNPEVIGMNTLNVYLRINPPATRCGGPLRWNFETWSIDEAQEWRTGEWDWSDLEAGEPDGDGSVWDDLINSLGCADAEGVLNAFSRLRGGGIEFHDWT